MDGIKDTPVHVFFVGLLLPAVILLVVAFNVFAWRVYWPANRSAHALVKVYTGGWHVMGTVLIKAGFAGAFFAWFFLANCKRTERTAQVWLSVAIGLCAVGLLVFSAGFFV